MDVIPCHVLQVFFYEPYKDECNHVTHVGWSRLLNQPYFRHSPCNVNVMTVLHVGLRLNKDSHFYVKLLTSWYLSTFL